MTPTVTFKSSHSGFILDFHPYIYGNVIMKTNKNDFFKNGEQEGKTGPVWGLAPVCMGDIRKGCRR
jgi:hypothetical protein